MKVSESHEFGLIHFGFIGSASFSSSFHQFHHFSQFFGMVLGLDHKLITYVAKLRGSRRAKSRVIIDTSIPPNQISVDYDQKS